MTVTAGADDFFSMVVYVGGTLVVLVVQDAVSGAPCCSPNNFLLKSNHVLDRGIGSARDGRLDPEGRGGIRPDSTLARRRASYSMPADAGTCVVLGGVGSAAK